MRWIGEEPIVAKVELANAGGTTIRAQIHTYDVLSRLTSTSITETVNSVVQREALAWTFDAVGNRLTETVTRNGSRTNASA